MKDESAEDACLCSPPAWGWSDPRCRTEPVDRVLPTRVGMVRALAEVLRGADDERKPVTLHVERNNRALAWYERLGFTVVEDHGVYLFLRREPPEVPEQGS